MSDEIARLLTAQNAILSTISHQLDQIVAGNAPTSPNYRRHHSEFAAFDWAQIGASVIASDSHGALEVEWNGHRFDRAKGEKFGGPFIIFSRPAEGWSQTNKVYHTLIRFADYVAEPATSPAPVQAQGAPGAGGKAGGGQHAKPAPAPAKPRPAQATPPKADNSPTAYWALAAPLLASGKLSHAQAKATAESPGTWAEKAARLLS